MMTRKSTIGWIRWFLIVNLLAISWVAQGASLAAKKKKVEVISKPKKGSAVVETLKKGDLMESLGRAGMYWKVKTSGGKVGFVFVTKVKRKSTTGNSLAKAIRAAAKDGREENDDSGSVRARSAVMGVRGLDESGETAFAGNVKPNLRMVYTMEDRRVSRKNIDHLGNMVMKEVEVLAEQP